MKNSRFLSVCFVLSCCVFTVTGCSSSKSSDIPSSSDVVGEKPGATNDSDKDGIIDSEDNCPNIANANQADSDEDGRADACDQGYFFADSAGVSTVSYTGQTARHIIIADLFSNITSLNRSDTRTKAEVVQQEFNKYYLNILEDGQISGAALDTADIAYSLDGTGDLVTNSSDTLDMTLGSISTGKSLQGKIAGMDKCNHILSDGINMATCGEAEAGTVRGEFFGWEAGLDADPLARTPDAFVATLFDWLAEEVTKQTLTVAHGTSLDVSAVYLDGMGRDLAQLIQKFMLGAIAFSQATTDYLQTDFGSEAALTLKEGKVFTNGQHSFDEAFGYYGAAQNTPAYTDLEARGGKSEADGARLGFEYGYNDINADSQINIRSEVMLGNSTNCAKRDLGTVNNGVNATNYSAEVFDAFVAGRYILQKASDLGKLGDVQQMALDAQIKIAAQTWEKCIAATVVHYINELDVDLSKYVGGDYLDLLHYQTVAKHWSEMKGFALGLQFSPFSPFRLGENSADIDGLKTVLSNMGDAPVLADGTQLGLAYTGGVAAYRVKLMEARNILQAAYDFAPENVESW